MDEELRKFFAEVDEAETRAQQDNNVIEQAAEHDNIRTDTHDAHDYAAAHAQKKRRVFSNSSAVIAKPAEPAKPRATHKPASLASAAAPHMPPRAGGHAADGAATNGTAADGDMGITPATAAANTTAAPVYQASADPPNKAHIPAHQQHQVELPEHNKRNERGEPIVPPGAPPNHPARATTANPDPLPAEMKRSENTLEVYRAAAGEHWCDPTLADWPENDYRIFVGNLGPEATDEILARNFSQYPSFARARVVRDKRTGKTRGYGFVSMLDSREFARALREMHGRYVGNRPVQLKRSRMHERQDDHQAAANTPSFSGKKRSIKRKHHLPV